MREQLNKNSGNRFNPPSTDSFKKVNKSLREKSGKKRGEQKGHKGTHHAVLSKPDDVKRHMHADCASCCIGISAQQRLALRKNGMSLTQLVEVYITAHEKLCVEMCPPCGESKTGAFLKDVKANIQYGKYLQALVVAFNTVGAVSVNRIHEDKAALNATYRKLSKSPLVHCDETGTNIDGKLHWVHNALQTETTHV